MESTHVSWLMLERYWLGELGPDEQARVKLALEQSEELRHHLERIESDARLPLRPLPPPPAPKPRQGWWVIPSWRGLLLVTAAVVMVVNGWRLFNRPPSQERPKGDAAVLELVRESGGTMVEDASVFVDGDVFKVQLTCSRQGPVSWQLSVFQGREVFFPLPAAEPIHCGNRVSLPGAFRVSGTSPALVCIAFDEDIVPPERLAKEGIAALPAAAACVHLRPVARP